MGSKGKKLKHSRLDKRAKRLYCRVTGSQFLSGTREASAIPNVHIPESIASSVPEGNSNKQETLSKHGKGGLIYGSHY